MKVSIRNNRLSIRLSEAEAGNFVRNRMLTECLEFGNGQVLRYTLKAAKCDVLHAGFEQNEIIVHFPENQLDRLKDNAGKSIEHSPENANVLKISVRTEMTKTSDRNSGKKPGSGPQSPLLIDIIE